MATLEAVRDAVLSAASENSDLLNKLAKTSEAPSLLRGHLIHLSRLETSLAEQTSTLDSLRMQTETKFKSHKKLRDSATRKLFYRATNMLPKFEAKAMKEEREYFATLGTQSKAEERRKVIEREFKRVKREKEELERIAREHESTHKRIDGLYERLFEGPTPGFGDEDEREEEFYTARDGNESVKEAIQKARRAKGGLGVMQTYLLRAKSSLANAEQSAEESILFFDQALYHMDRGNGILNLVLEAARKTEEHLLPLPQNIFLKYQALLAQLDEAKIPVERLYSRDGILSAIQVSQDSLLEAEGGLRAMVEHAKEAEKVGLSEIRETARRLEDARQELQQIRQGIFERVAGFGEAAPAYNECCDRADGFCVVPDVGHEHLHPEEEAPRQTGGEHESIAQLPPKYEHGSTATASRFGLADVLREDRDTY